MQGVSVTGFLYSMRHFGRLFHNSAESHHNNVNVY